MNPELAPDQVAPELIGVGAKALVENADRLGLTWQLVLGTVSQTNPSLQVILDGDSGAIGVVSMIGNLIVGQRVYIIQVPPSGNFVTGYATGGPYRARQTLNADATSVVFTNIPTDLASLQVRWVAKGTFAAQNVTLGMRFNGSSSAVYYWQDLRGVNVTVTTGGVITQTYAILGLTTGASASTDSFGSGVCDIAAPDRIASAAGSMAMGWNYRSKAIGSAAAGFSTTTGGGVMTNSTGALLSSLTFLVADGGSILSGSDFQLYGERLSQL